MQKIIRGGGCRLRLWLKRVTGLRRLRGDSHELSWEVEDGRLGKGVTEKQQIRTVRVKEYHRRRREKSPKTLVLAYGD